MKLKKGILTLSLIALAMVALAPQSMAQSLDDFEDKVTEFTLDNGLTFIVVERPVAPVASMVSFVNVGGANEPVGHTGIAHIFEHMAFKGTSSIGTTNWKKEQKVLQQVDEKYNQWLEEKYSAMPDSIRMEELWNEFTELQDEAGQYVKNNEFSQIIQRNGGTGLNAGTGADQTSYFYSLPENRLELWFSLESARFMDPVFREFYKEKEVVREERRMRTESQPVGRLLEEFMAVAYTAHPYGRPVVGWNSDITATTLDDARDFYNTYYVPNNITMAIVGDVEPANIKKLAKTYFGDMESAPEPPPVYTKEPEQRGERSFQIEGNSQPFLLMGYHTVPESHPDFAALQLLGNVLSGGRTSVLYKKMVEENQSALAVQALSGLPGTKYESMFLTFAVPNQGIATDSLKASILEEIENVKEGDINPEALERARTNQRANLIRSLGSNTGIANALAAAEAQQGDWRTYFTDIDDLEQVSVDDLQRVANKYLTQDNRTVGVIVNSNDSE